MAEPRRPLKSKSALPIERMPTNMTVALIMHELRAGVYNIKQSASMLSRLLTLPAPPIEKLRECARDINVSASLAVDFLEDVRTLRIRGQDPQPRTSISSTEVNAYIQALIAELRPRLGRSIEVRTRYGAKADCSVHARARLLTQALRILIDWAFLWAIKSVEINTTQVHLRQKPSALVVAVSFEMPPVSDVGWQQEISGRWSPRHKRLGIAVLKKLARENQWKVTFRRGLARGTAHEVVEARLELPMEKAHAG